jgi:metal-responsive CopG/Arc/MetJ family transcriptional regulator
MVAICTAWAIKAPDGSIQLNHIYDHEINLELHMFMGGHRCVKVEVREVE